MPKTVMSPLARDDVIPSSISRGMSDKLRFAVVRSSSRGAWDVLLSNDFRLLTDFLQCVLDRRGKGRTRIQAYHCRGCGKNDEGCERMVTFSSFRRTYSLVVFPRPEGTPLY